MMLVTLLVEQSRIECPSSMHFNKQMVIWSRKMKDGSKTSVNRKQNVQGLERSGIKSVKDLHTVSEVESVAWQ